jgi:hypothetical protein
MKTDADILAHRREFARAVANHKYEVSPHGLFFPAQKLFIGGAMETTLNGRDPDVSPNIIPTEGLNHLLSILVAGGTQVNPWYVALFSGNVTPGASYTAANFASNATEITTGYSETTRVPYVDGTIAAGAVDNDASRAEFTSTATQTVYGGALLSVETKGSTSGTLLAAARFSASRAMVSGDTLQVKYTLSATSS